MKALHAKLVWLITTDDSIFAEFMKAKYMENGKPHNKSCHKNSNLWKTLIKIWGDFEANTTKFKEILIWKPDKSGMFTTKSAWRTLRNTSERWALSNVIWKSYIPLKMSVLYWKIWNKGLPTDENIKKCNIKMPSKCLCCQNPQEETLEHLFSNSDAVWGVWEKLAKNFGINLRREWDWRNKCRKWWQNTQGNDQVQMVASCIPIIIFWEVWKLRNNNRHKDNSCKPYDILPKVINWLKDINFSITPRSPISEFKRMSLLELKLELTQVKIKKPFLVKWIPPTAAPLKLNIDGSAKHNPGEIGAGGIIRDSMSNLLVAFSEHIGEGTNNQAEMQALLTGLVIAYQLGIEKIETETDSKLLYNWVHRSTPPWELWSIWENIQHLLDIIDVKFSHIYREANCVADILAKNGADGQNQIYFDKKELPDKALKNWVMDTLGIPQWRHPKN